MLYLPNEEAPSRLLHRPASPLLLHAFSPTHWLRLASRAGSQSIGAPIRQNSALVLPWEPRLEGVFCVSVLAGEGICIGEVAG